jgi:hypothetical protein
MPVTRSEGEEAMRRTNVARSWVVASAVGLIVALTMPNGHAYRQTITLPTGQQPTIDWA